MSYPKVLLIFGAGPRIGLATIKKFSSEGYKVAVVSRNPSKELQEAADLVVPANLKDPEQIKPVFERVIQELGVPHVVIYNGMCVCMCVCVFVTCSHEIVLLSLAFFKTRQQGQRE